MGFLFESIEDNFDAWPVRDPKNFSPPMSLYELQGQILKSQPTKGRHPAEPMFTFNLLATNKKFIQFVTFSELVATVYLFKPFLAKTIPGYRHLPYKGEKYSETINCSRPISSIQIHS